MQIMCKKAKWPPEVGCAVFDFAKLCIITKAKDRPPMNQVRLNTHTQSETDTHCPLRPVCLLPCHRLHAVPSACLAEALLVSVCCKVNDFLSPPCAQMIDQIEDLLAEGEESEAA